MSTGEYIDPSLLTHRETDESKWIPVHLTLEASKLIGSQQDSQTQSAGKSADNEEAVLSKDDEEASAATRGGDDQVQNSDWFGYQHGSAFRVGVKAHTSVDGGMEFSAIDTASLPLPQMPELSDNEDINCAQVSNSSDVPNMPIRRAPSPLGLEDSHTLAESRERKREARWVAVWMKHHVEDLSTGNLAEFFNPDIARVGHVLGDIFQSEVEWACREAADPILELWDAANSSGIAGPEADEAYDLQLSISRVIALKELNAGDTDDAPTDDKGEAYMTDLLGEALCRRAQTLFKDTLVSNAQEVFGILARSMAALYSTGYSKENLEAFIEQHKDNLGECNPGEPWILRSQRMESPVRRCLIRLSPPSGWTPVDCKTYKLSGPEKWDTADFLRASGCGSKIPAAWDDIKPPTLPDDVKTLFPPTRPAAEAGLSSMNELEELFAEMDVGKDRADGQKPDKRQRLHEDVEREA